MSGPVRPPLTVAESDGTPTVRPVSTISLNSADFTLVDQGGGTVRIDVNPGGGTSLTATQIGFGDASNLLTGDSVFTYTTPSSNPTVTIGDSTLQDQGGNFRLQGRDNVQILSGSTFGSIKFYPATGSSGSAMDIAYTGMVNVNPGQQANGDFKVEGENVEELLRTDASQDNVGIGTSPDSAVERLHVHGTGTTDMVMLESTDAGSTSAPDLVLYRNSASPADNDYIGRFDFRGTNSGGSDINYAMMITKINDVSNDAGRLSFLVSGNGSVNADDSQLMIFGRTGLTGNPGLVSINNSARSDCDFRVSGDTIASLIRTDASQDNVGIGVNPDSTVERLHVQGTDASKDLVMFESTDTDGNDDGPDLVLYRSKESPGDGTQLGSIKFRGRNNATADIGYAHIEAEVESGFGTSANGLLRFGVVADGTTPTDVLYVSGNNGTVPNVGIGTIPDNAVERLHVKGSGTDTLVRLESSDAGASNAPDLELFRNSPSPADADYTGAVIFSGYEDSAASSKVDYARIDTRMFGIDGTESGVLTLYSRQNNALRPQISMKQNGVTINENNESVFDFRIETSGNSNTVVVDSSQDNVGIGAAPSSAGAQFQVNEDATFQSFITNQNSTTILTSALVKNSKIICNPSSNITVTLPPGSEGDRVTIVNVSASNTAQLAFDISDSSIEAGSGTHPRALSQAETETWLCYKDNNWVLESFV